MRPAKCLAMLAFVLLMCLSHGRASQAGDWQPIPPIAAPPAIAWKSLIVDLNAVIALPDSHVLVAVGNDGTIRRSEDRGRSWINIPTETHENLESLVALPGNGPLIAVGTKGTVLRSEDSGSSWQAIKVSTDHFLGGVAALADGHTVVAVGASGTIFRSGDAGLTWSAISAGTDANIYKVAAANDGKTLIAVFGVAGAALRSEDGGRTWHSVLTAPKVYLNRIVTSADGKIFAAIGGIEDTSTATPYIPVVVLSFDAGLSWTSRTISNTTAAPLGIVALSDSQTLIVPTADDGLVARSTDEGKTWAFTSTYPTLTDMLDLVALDDSRTLVGVGARGSVFIGQSDGAAWTPISRITKDALFGGAVLDEHGTLVAVGGDNTGLIVRSGDGGATWDRPVMQGDSRPLYCVVALPDGHTAIAAGAGGALWHSDDSGKVWRRQGNISDRDIYSIAVARDSGKIIAVGGGGSISVSVDGGRTWRRRDGPSTANLLSVATSADGQIIVATGTGSTVLRSGDGGVTWTAATPLKKPFSELELRGVAMSADGKSMVVVGELGTIIYSADSGQTWATRRFLGSVLPSTNIGLSFNSVAMSQDGTVIMAAYEHGAILVSRDGGESWFAPVPIPHLWRSIFAFGISPSGRSAIAVGEHGTLLMSKNGGLSWDVTPNMPLGKNLYGVTVDQTDGEVLAVGDSGMTIRSNDAGVTWIPGQAPTNATLFYVVALSSHRVIAVGSSDTILRSDDGGQNWQKSAVPISGNALLSVREIADGRVVIAAGTKGLVRSTDGGETWQDIPVPTKQSLTNVAVLPDRRTAVVVGAQGTVLRSVDAGLTWNEIHIGATANLNAVLALPDGHTVLAGGDGGTLYRSDDAGLTWTFVSIASGEQIDSIAAQSDNSVIAIAASGVVLGSGDLGRSWSVQSIPGYAAHEYFGDVAARLGGAGYVAVTSTERIVALRSEARHGLVAANEVRMDTVSDAAQLGHQDLRISWSYPAGLTALCDHLYYNRRGDPPLKEITWPDRLGDGTADDMRRPNQMWYGIWWDPEAAGYNHGDEFRYFVSCTDASRQVRWIQSLPGFQTWEPVTVASWLTARWVWLVNLPLWQGVTVGAGVLATAWIVTALGFLALSPKRLVFMAEWFRRQIPSVPDPDEPGAQKLAGWISAIIILMNFLDFIVIGIFANRRRALNGWTVYALPSVEDHFRGMDLVRDRRIVVDIPVIFEAGGREERVDDPWPNMKKLLQRPSAAVLFVGPGGVGKTTLACGTASRLLGVDGLPPLLGHSAIPVFLDGDIPEKASAEFLCGRIAGILRTLIGQGETVSLSLTQRLLKQGRIVVIVDGLSERSPGTRIALDHKKHGFPIPRMIVTSREDGVLKLAEIVRVTEIPPGNLPNFIYEYINKLSASGDQTKTMPAEDRIYDAAGELKRLVRERPVTAMLATIWATELIDRPGEVGRLAASVADLMDKYIKGLLRSSPGHDDRRANDARVDDLYDDLIEIAKVEVGNTYRARFVPKRVATDALRKRNAEDDHVRLLILQDSGLIERRSDGSDNIHVTLDPIAEHLAAKSFLVAYGADESKWEALICDLRRRSDVEGFVSALVANTESEDASTLIPDRIKQQLRELRDSLARG